MISPVLESRIGLHVLIPGVPRRIQAARQDLIEQNETEARVLESYLPAAASPDEVRAEIAAAIAAGASQIGPIMKALRDKFGAGLDGKIASELAKEALAKK